MESWNIQSKIRLNTGAEMPVVAYNTELLGATAFDVMTQTEILLDAIKAGFRRFDISEMHHFNIPVSMGNAIRKSGIPREAFFITAQAHIEDLHDFRYYYAAEELLAKLGFEYLDLFLLTWPHPKVFLDIYEEKRRRALKSGANPEEAVSYSMWQKKGWVRYQEILADGKAKAIGVCNFEIHHLERILNDSDTKVIPAVNMNQFHPQYACPELRRYCEEKGIVFVALNEKDRQLKAVKPAWNEDWSRNYHRPGLYDRCPCLREVAERHGVCIDHVVARWILQHGALASVQRLDPQEMEADKALFSFALSDEEMERIDLLNIGCRIGYDPDNIDF